MTAFRVHHGTADWLGQREHRGQLTRGFVPTMGALHAGHASLIQKSANENERTLVSIFVNPTQFDDPSDLQNYPRTLEADLEICRSAGATDVLLPRADELYADQYRYKLTESQLSTRFCGAHRPGHFDGVLTVVLKLLNIAQARRAYFGEKDFQQLELIRGMVSAFFLPTEIVGCPIIRDESGLALSSRNTRLSDAQRAHAPEFNRILRASTDAQNARSMLEQNGFEVDYVEDFVRQSNSIRRLAAVRMGDVRLIDNVQI